VATLPGPASKGSVMHLKIGDHKYTKNIAANDTTAFIRGIDLPAGPLRLEAWVADDDAVRGTRFVEIRRE
jgi:hypothetical protein